MRSLVGTVGVFVVASSCADATPEPVQFALAYPELFAEGGALTDAWADYDLDGDPDRFVGFNGAPARLYRNDLIDGFVDVAAEIGVDIARSVRTSAWGDFDADGDPDLFLGFAGEAPVTALLRNDQDQGFTDVASEMGLSLDSGSTRQASWIDYDEDRDLDLFLAMRDGPNKLFRNDGEAGFIDVAPQLGLADPRRTVGASWFNVSGGGLDLVVGNMNGDPNALYLSGADGYVEAIQFEGLRQGGRAIGVDEEGTVRPCVVDFDSDGDFDLFFANYGANGLYSRGERETWTNVAESVGLATPSRYDTCAWGDFDHDGSVDLYVNGTVGGGTHYRDYLYRRQGAPSFVDVTPDVLLSLNASHGATWVDFDLDGDLDLSLAGAAEDGMHHVVRNLLRPEFSWHSLKVDVLDSSGRSTWPGSEVRLLRTGSREVLGTRLVDTGSAYDAQSVLPVHFGIPGGQPVDVEVTVNVSGSLETVRIDDIDPREWRGRTLEIRIDANGSLVR